MAGNVVRLDEIDPSQIALVGGKAASLAALTRVEGIEVPPGFGVTTAALATDQIAPDVAEAITAELEQLGEQQPVAVRSSATAEDLPGASFAGQYETYLDVVGAPAVLAAIERCRASLDAERAVAYRQRSAVDGGAPRMAVIVQRMVAARVSGVMFTADPVSSRRTVVAIEAVAGLGDQLVSGRGDPERWTVTADGQLTRSDGAATLLSDAQVHELAQLGRRIAARFGAPQDIEWCLAGDGFRFVQSRPITTLFPVPEAGDEDFHLYVSVGHQQMMTDAIKPFGISMWQLTTPRPMAEAGGRLFVDIAQDLRTPARLAVHVEVLGRSDPLIGDALQTILARGEIVPEPPADGEPEKLPRWADPAPLPAADPALVTELIEARRASVAAAAREIAALTGAALLEYIRADLAELRRLLFEPRSSQVVMAGTRAAWWLTEHLRQWLGDSGDVDTLTKSLSHNVTAEMGLALLDVADEIRPHPEVVALLRAAHDDEFLQRLPALPGGEQACDAIERYLDAYGMRCEGEIDITRPRWSERPSMLLPMLLADVDGLEPGAGRLRFAQGLEEAQRARGEILARVRQLPDGELKAAESEAMIDRIRAFAGYREYPKYGMISRYFIYRRALIGEAGRLVAAGVIDDPDDIFFLRFEELEDVVRSGRADRALIQARRDRYRRDEPLIPPRVMTSEGEVITGSYHRHDLPAGALPGLAVSGGIVEGRARVILDVAHAELAPGDILVTTFTDPSWTPVFVAISGLVTEVGGLMTHGAVIAREYGLPAVVGVPDATRLIPDGHRIRVHGGDGYVELLDQR